MKFSEWLTYIQSLHPKTIALGLDRVQAAAEKLSIQKFNCPVITIAGTNGKGSCVAFLESILQASGRRVGAYTSPHLLRFNERIRIAGQEVSDHDLVKAFAQIEHARAALQIELTFFEFTTLAALYLFQQSQLDVLLLEVGLGGRKDAVNIVEPDIAIITTIALDHMDWLGDTREAIGWEKAGIFRSQKPAICGDFEPPESVLFAAQEIQAPLYCMRRDFDYSLDVAGKTWEWRSAKTQLKDLPLPQLPLQNAATALMGVALLQSLAGFLPGAIKHGISTARVPGRFQQLSSPVNTILDVAHNPAAAAYLAQKLRQTPHIGRTYAVVSLLTDKDIPATLNPLLSCVDEWFICGLEEIRGGTCEMMENHLQNLGVSAYHKASSVLKAYQLAVEHCRPEDRIVVFGSFHTVAPVLEFLEDLWISV